jgi:hypothetical protein
MPSLAYRQFTTAAANSVYDGGDIINQILSEGEDYYDQGTAYLLRVTTCYWKSQKKVGHLTKISDNGEVLTDIITEDYVKYQGTKEVIDKYYNCLDEGLFEGNCDPILIVGIIITWN